jgi:putative ABC transport system permease protein
MGPESVRIALRGIGSNKLRSSLTVLGILIGVSAVIMLVAVGNGSSIAVQDRIQRLGVNTLTVSNRGRAGSGPRAPGTQSTSVKITQGDVDALNDKSQAADIVSASPVVSVSSATAVHDTASTTVTTFIGSDASYLGTTDRTVDLGRALTTDDIENHSRVIVLGRTTAGNLFTTGEDVIGATVRINGTSFTVVGVQATKGTNGNQDLDAFAIAPYTAVQDTLASRTDGFSQIVVQATSADAQNAAQAEIVSILDSRHAITATASASGSSATSSSPFTVQNQGSLLQTAQDTNQTFTVLLGAVAAISLVVGGIGVMNIMLVSVTERTREIGIRKAIGAPRRAIMSQFIFEAVILSLIGGLAGVAAGIIGSQFMIVGIIPVVAPSSILLAFAVSIAIGLFFGIYPAHRAATMRPIDALRHE